MPEKHKIITVFALSLEFVDDPDLHSYFIFSQFIKLTSYFEILKCLSTTTQKHPEYVVRTLPYWDRLLPYIDIRRPYTGIYKIVFRRFRAVPLMNYFENLKTPHVTYTCLPRSIAFVTMISNTIYT